MEITKSNGNDLHAPPYLVPLPVRDALPAAPEAKAALRRLEIETRKRGNTLVIEEMTRHHFADGLYSRQWNQQAGTMAISKTHAKENFLVLLQGECIISTGIESEHLCAPHIIRTMPGVKRGVYAITDITIVTFHPNPTNERDLKKLEELYITPEPPWDSEEESS